MTPFTALLAILALFILGVTIVAWTEGLAFLAPKRTGALNGCAGDFCRGTCRTPDGRCPLSGTEAQALNCPLWKFIEADVPTVAYGSPFPVSRTA
jgi:hypothetical protein